MAGPQQLPRWGHYDGVGPVEDGVRGHGRLAPDVDTHGDDEGGGLPGACLGHTDDVSALEADRDGLHLDGRTPKPRAPMQFRWDGTHLALMGLSPLKLLLGTHLFKGTGGCWAWAGNLGWPARGGGVLQKP